MRHEPRGTIRPVRLAGVGIDSPQIAPKLVSTDALFAGAHQVDRQEPFVKRDVRVLKYGPDGHRERLPARRALVQSIPVGFALQPECFADDAAVRTDRTIRPQSLL